MNSQEVLFRDVCDGWRVIHLLDGAIFTDLGAESDAISRSFDQLMASTNAVEGIEPV